MNTYIVILGEAEELADLGRALRAQSLGVDGVGHAWDVVVALLDDGEGQDGEVHGDDAAADGFALALAGAAGAEAGVAVGEEEAHSSWVHDSLLHGETLLVVAAGDLEDIAFEFIADAITCNLCAHSVRVSAGAALWIVPIVPLVHENTELSLIFNVDQLLAAIGRLWGVSVRGFGKFRDGRAGNVRRRCSKRRKVSRCSQLMVS